MTSYLLDSDTFLFLLKGNLEIQNKVTQIGFTSLAVSVITVGEVLHGAYNSSNPTKNLSETRQLLTQFQTLALTDVMADLFGTIKADLKKAGQVIADFDLLIGATALTTSRVLVTNNTKHFSRLGSYGLAIENWKV